MSCPYCGGCGYVRQIGCAQEELCGCVDAHVKEALEEFTFEELAHASSGSDVFSRAVAEAFKESLPEGVEFYRGDLSLRSGFEIIPNRKTPVPDVLDLLRRAAAKSRWNSSKKDTPTSILMRRMRGKSAPL